MTTGDLSCLFKGKSVAVIGASERTRTAGLFRNLQQMGFPRENLFPVNPNRSRVFDLPCYRGILEIQQPIDLAVIATNRDSVLEAVRQCIEKKVKGALVFADGFAESGEEGRLLQQKITELCRAHGFLLCGPNCMGFVVPGERLGLWSSDLPVPFPPGNVSAVFQSSGVLTLFLRQVALRGLGFRIAVATGNQAALTLEDYLSYAVEDPETKLIIMYVEAITKPRDLANALDRALELEKPVIAMRVGKTDRSRRNVVAHTGNLAATGMAWDAILQQKGVTLVGNFDEFVEAIVLFSVLRARRPIARGGVGLISVSGGDCSFLSDLCERIGLVLPDLSPASRQKIGDYLGKSTLLGNPLDIENLRRQNEAGFYESIELFMSEPSLEVVGCRLTLPTKPSEGVKEDCRRIAQLAEAHQKLLIFMSRGSEGVDAEWLEFFSGLGIPFIQEYERGLKAIKAWLRYRELCQRKNHSLKVAVAPNDRVASLRASIGQHRQRVLPYELGMQLLAAYGIPAAGGGLAPTPDAAQEIVARIGFPVALKVASADVPHKSDIGALALNVETADGLAQGFRRVVEAARKAVPQAIIEGVVVQKMVRGVEVIVGVYKEPGLGPVVMFGLGGVFVEVLKDVSFRCPPFGLDVAREMIDEIRGKAVLQGVRGLPQADIAALADAIWRLSHLALDFDDEIDQLEVNPLIVLGEGQGVVAVDVLAVAQQE